MKASLVPAARIERAILVLRGHKILLDADLAALYEVPTKALLQAVRRNRERFPQDFMFQLDKQEFAILRSQIVTSSWGGRRTVPCASTEQGVAMLSTVLNSPRAIAVNIEIMRAFVRLRELIASNKELAAKLDQLEKKLTTHDKAITKIMHAIRQLMTPPEPAKKRPIGFITSKET
ncbi:MAG: ORF6N domain-containing protein [Burkholderiales bacterium]